jgi:hypothetical protein
MGRIGGRESQLSAHLELKSSVSDTWPENLGPGLSSRGQTATWSCFRSDPCARSDPASPADLSNSLWAGQFWCLVPKAVPLSTFWPIAWPRKKPKKPYFMGAERLELSHLAVLDPKSSASANSATHPRLPLRTTPAPGPSSQAGHPGQRDGAVFGKPTEPLQRCPGLCCRYVERAPASPPSEAVRMGDPFPDARPHGLQSGRTVRRGDDPAARTDRFIPPLSRRAHLAGRRSGRAGGPGCRADLGTVTAGGTGRGRTLTW